MHISIHRGFRSYCDNKRKRKSDHMLMLRMHGDWLFITYAITFIMTPCTYS